LLTSLISSDIDEFLEEEIRGPGIFTTQRGKAKFDEPAMNQLISDVFGDTFITLECNAGECMRKGMIPGRKSPKKEKRKNGGFLIASILVCAGIVVIVSLCELISNYHPS
jgi:hypothetical protein